MSDPIAILLFARPVAEDAAQKRLTSHARSNQRVLKCLNKHVEQVAAATGLPVLRSTDLIAHRGTFGDQLATALQAAFDHGFERVLVVGNDCPALTTAHLLGAADALRATPVVLGPDRRGGLYLLGLSRDAFDKTLLTQLPWQTPALSRITRRAFANWPTTWLARLGDVNHLADLRTYRAADPTARAFVVSLLALVAQRGADGFSVITRPVKAVDWLGGGSLRAPPAHLSPDSFVVA